MNLQDWANANEPGNELIYKPGYWHQICFFRDHVQAMLGHAAGLEYEQRRKLCTVSGTHMSKSVTLPVFCVSLPGLTVWARYNFHDWNVSVESVRAVDCDFVGLFSDESHGYCFCQGMEAQKFGRYSEDPRRFTVCLSREYECWAFFHVLSRWYAAARNGGQ